MERLDHLGWVVQRSYEIGDTLVGLRTNSHAAAQWLEATLGPLEVEEKLDAYYSLYVGEQDGVGKRFHILYAESRPVVKTLDFRLLAQVLLAELESLRFEQREDAVYLRSAVVGLDGVSALVPQSLIEYIEQLGLRTVVRAGLIWPADPGVAVDLAGQIVPVAPVFDVSPEAQERLHAVAPSSGRDQRTLRTAPCRPDVLISVGLPGDEVQPLSRGTALYQLALRSWNLDRVREAGLAALRRMIEDVPCYEMRAPNPKDALATLVALLRSAT